MTRASQESRASRRTCAQRRPCCTRLGPVTDVLAPKGDYICAPNIHTDGAYAWPEDLAYYVERYHVALPPEFLAHLATAKWKAPADVDTSTIELG
ncbi:MAG TPA: hypothetical protein VHW23_35615 [Kofleriaceae bacterium]|nr:hypothetical protein [Kofleriaceae bacterium]